MVKPNSLMVKLSKVVVSSESCLRGCKEQKEMYGDQRTWIERERFRGSGQLSCLLTFSLILGISSQMYKKNQACRYQGVVLIPIRFAVTWEEQGKLPLFPPLVMILGFESIKMSLDKSLGWYSLYHCLQKMNLIWHHRFFFSPQREPRPQEYSGS